MPRTLTRTRLFVAAAAALALLVALAMPPGAGAAEISLAAYYNNNGITQNPLTPAAFDYGCCGYSSIALLTQNVRGGSQVTADGMTFTWPNTASGANDNMFAKNQVIPLLPTNGETRVGFLGASTNGPVTADFVLNYTYLDANGVRQERDVVHEVGVTDWTRNAGGREPEQGNTTAITMPFRATGSPQPETISTYVFAWSIPIDPTMTLQGITFPDDPRVHIFSMVLA